MSNELRTLLLCLSVCFPLPMSDRVLDSITCALFPTCVLTSAKGDNSVVVGDWLGVIDDHEKYRM